MRFKAPECDQCGTEIMSNQSHDYCDDCYFKIHCEDCDSKYNEDTGTCPICEEFEHILEDAHE